MKRKRIIIAGGRDFENWEMFYQIVTEYLFVIDDDTEIVHGGAKGADNLAKEYAELDSVPVKEFKADWIKHGKGAGVIRNEEMAKYGNVLIAFWDGKSRGTKNMIDNAIKHKLDIHIHFYDESNKQNVVGQNQQHNYWRLDNI